LLASPTGKLASTAINGVEVAAGLLVVAVAGGIAFFETRRL
jgi:hypothetical protein